MGYGDGWGHMGSWGWIGMLLMLVFWFGLIALIVSAFGGFGGRHTNARFDDPSRRDSASLVLRERYARGEINADEYAQAQKTLNEASR